MTSVSNAYPRALLIHQAALGDFLIACRLMEFCDGRLGKHRWSLLGKPSHGRLARSLGLIDSFEDFDSAGWYLLFTPDQAIPERNRAFLNHFDLIVNAVSGPDTPLAQRLIGLAGGRTLHADPKLPADCPRHAFEHLAGQLAIGPVGELPKTAFSVDSALLDRMRQEISTDQLVLFHPGASAPAKRWPLVNFIRLMRQAQRTGDQIGILLGEVELEQFTAADRQTLQSLGQTFISWPLENLAALLASAKGYVGNDNGVSHLAAAVGTDTTVIFLQPNAHQWHPLGPKVCIRQV